MTDTPTDQRPNDEDGQISVQDYVERLTAEASGLLQRAVQAESLAARYRAERDEAREAVAQTLAAGRVPTSPDSEG